MSNENEELQLELEPFKKPDKNSDYKNFNALRNQKLHTPYVCFRRNTVKHYLDYKHHLEHVTGTPQHLVLEEDEAGNDLNDFNNTSTLPNINHITPQQVHKKDSLSLTV